MGIKIDNELAEKILFKEANRALKGKADPVWESRVRRLSEACEKTYKTHIAFLGTAILAKCTNISADAFSVKKGAKTKGAYSARGLGHSVLVPNAPKLGISLGVTGREPLNNQPYFRVKRATKKELLPLVRDKSKESVHILCEILSELDKLSSTAEAKKALRAFIKVRRDYVPVYKTQEAPPGSLSLEDLIQAVEDLTRERTEGGKIAQAIAAGMMDMFSGAERVETGRINDPDRHVPGDVGVRTSNGKQNWERVFEVRDKPVSEQDLILFTQKAAMAGSSKAAVLAVAKNQKKIETKEAIDWAKSHGIALTVFWDWESFIRQAVFWSKKPRTEAATQAYNLIQNRLIEMEASEEAVDMWNQDR